MNPTVPARPQKISLHQLQKFRVAHLATADLKAKPSVVPICFACSRDSIYSVIDEKPKRVASSRLRRVRNIQANPQVCFVADHYEENWRRLSYILIEGAAELLTSGAEHAAAIRLLRQKYLQYRDMEISDKPVIKIAPLRLIAWKAS